MAHVITDAMPFWLEFLLVFSSVMGLIFILSIIGAIIQYFLDKDKATWIKLEASDKSTWPDKDKSLLIYVPHHHEIHVAYLTHNFGKVYFDVGYSKFTFIEVSHWLEIPEIKT